MPKENPLKICSYVGCPCEGTHDKRSAGRPSDNHHPIKAYEGGYIFYVASYGPRYCNADTTFVSLRPGAALEAAEQAADYDRANWPAYCDNESCEGKCCKPDMCVYDDGPTPTRSIFIAEELRMYRRILLKGGIVTLYT